MAKNNGSKQRWERCVCWREQQEKSLSKNIYLHFMEEPHIPTKCRQGLEKSYPAERMEVSTEEHRSRNTGSEAAVALPQLFDLERSYQLDLLWKVTAHLLCSLLSAIFSGSPGRQFVYSHQWNFFTCIGINKSPNTRSVWWLGPLRHIVSHSIEICSTWRLWFCFWLCHWGLG